MARQERFTFLINSDERRMIATLAKRLKSESESDAVRFVIREAVQALDAQSVNPSAQAAQAVQHVG